MKLRPIAFLFLF